MGDLKTRLHNARIKLMRRTSAVAVPQTTGANNPPATATSTATSTSITTDKGRRHEKSSLRQKTIRRSASLSKLITPRSPQHRSHHPHPTSSDSSEEEHPLSASLPLPPPENVARKRSSSTLADRQHLEQLRSGSLSSSKDLISHSPGTIHEDAITPQTQDTVVSDAPSSIAHTSTDPPLVVLQQPSPPEHITTPPIRPTTDMNTRLHTSPHNAYRKVWVKRPHQTATLVKIKDDDLVDDVKDMILTKYGNSLGRNFDAPDVCIRIVPRETTQKAQDRTLGPEEEICRLIDAFFPGGQTIDEALVIDVPQRRTPKPSPRAHHAHHYYEGDTARPMENGTDYFPIMPLNTPPHAAHGTTAHDRHPEQRSMTVVSTGQVPPLPSPGYANRKHRHNRPQLGRQHTSSPTVLATAPIVVQRPPRIRHDSQGSEPRNAAHAPAPPPLPTPPAPDAAATSAPSVPTPPAPRVSSPRPSTTVPQKARPDKRKKAVVDDPPPSLDLLNDTVPPINVLIVEDNMINLRVLGAFMQRLQVRWEKAVDGQKAVEQWRKGGFHLVLMDIQLPIMNGLDATREIRRLERINRIGALSGLKPQLKPEEEEELAQKDRLDDISLFKSPVIIVALTASSLQSDRHEALAAGCNDFLTKPVNFLWLERKVKEWGCMQALIDFDGWRKWKDFRDETDSSKSRPGSAASSKTAKPNKNRKSLLQKAVESGANASAAKDTDTEGSKDTDTDSVKETDSTFVMAAASRTGTDLSQLSAATDISATSAPSDIDAPVPTATRTDGKPTVPGGSVVGHGTEGVQPEDYPPLSE